MRSQLDRVRSELLLKRNLVPAAGADTPAAAGALRVMQWNVLADHYAAPGDFPAAPAAVLDWSYRRWKLLEEVLVRDPDLLAMQEVDAKHFAGFWAPELAQAGYEGIYEPKQDGEDGSALFFRRCRFGLAARRRVEFPSPKGTLENQVFLLAALAPIGADPPLAVGVVHLKAGEESEATRERQVDRVLGELGRSAGEWNAPAAVLLGDFNSLPSWQVYRHVFEHPLALRSAYALAADPAAAASLPAAAAAEPPLTTAKLRQAGKKGEGEAAPGALKLKSVVEDYIFVSPSLRVARVLGVPPLEALGPAALPSAVCGSDHLCLLADLLPS